MSRVLTSRRARWSAATGALLLVATIAAMVSGGGAANADSTDRSDNTVNVSGTGKVSATPDVMHVDLGVQRTDQDLNAALTNANADLARIKAALRQHGVSEADIQTSQLSINQHYGPIQPVATPDAVAPDDAVAPVPPPDTAVTSPGVPVAPPVYGGDNRPNGYDVLENVAVTIRNLGEAGATISDAAAAGGDASRINGVSFAIDDRSKLLQQARDAAFADAKSKAEQYAKLAGRSLGKVSVISEGSSTDGGGVVYPMERSAMSAGSAVPVSSGSQDVTLTTNVTWELN
jgi:uncharacterized protein